MHALNHFTRPNSARSQTEWPVRLGLWRDDDRDLLQSGRLRRQRRKSGRKLRLRLVIALNCTNCFSMNLPCKIPLKYFQYDSKTFIWWCSPCRLLPCAFEKQQPDNTVYHQWPPGQIKGCLKIYSGLMLSLILCMVMVALSLTNLKFLKNSRVWRLLLVYADWMHGHCQPCEWTKIYLNYELTK